MEIKDYLARQARHIEQATSKIKDFQVFDFNYIPQKPLMREEVKPIIDAALSYAKTGIGSHLFLFGSRGSGKTLMVKYIIGLLAQQQALEFLYVNCRQHNTSFKILAHLLGVRPRGASLDELFVRFCDRHQGRVILVLDEVDLISDKDRHRDILYLLSRSESSPMLILLSNHPRFLSTLDESIRSTLQPELIHFRNYDAAEIAAILRQRAKSGLHLAPEGIIGQIAALTVKAINSDVRVAIKALYHAALGRAVEEAFAQARRDLTAELLMHLSDANLIMLKAASEESQPLVKPIYQRYRRLCKELGLEPFSYVYFYGNLSYLQSVGLILLSTTKLGRTYTNRVELLFQAELLSHLYQRRFS